MASLVHCIYASAAVDTLCAPDLVSLLDRARGNNAQLGLTGMLLYCERSFFQVLEGTPDAVESLFARIVLDRRHVQVTRILSEPIPKRSFAEWTMGFSALSREELTNISESNDFFGAGRCLTDMGPGRAQKLLAAFRLGRWRKHLGAVAGTAAA